MRLVILTTLVHLPAAFTTPDVIGRMTAAYEELEALEAEIVQTSSYPQLGLTDPPETGRLQIEKTREGMNVRLEFTEPVRRILVVKDGEYVLYQPRINQAIVGSAGRNRDRRTGGFLKYLVGDLSGVEEHFRIEILGLEQVSGRQTTHIRLVPRDPADSHYQRIELWVDEELSLPIREKLVEPNGDEILIRLNEIRVDPPTDHFEFEIDLPPDVERIRG